MKNQPRGNPYRSSVLERPIDGGSTSSLFLICLPAGLFWCPIWTMPLKKVPVVITTLEQGIVSKSLVITPFIFSSFSSITKSSILIHIVVNLSYKYMVLTSQLWRWGLAHDSEGNFAYFVCISLDPFVLVVLGQLHLCLCWGLCSWFQKCLRYNPSSRLTHRSLWSVFLFLFLPWKAIWINKKMLFF